MLNLKIDILPKVLQKWWLMLVANDINIRAFILSNVVLIKFSTGVERLYTRKKKYLLYRVYDYSIYEYIVGSLL